MSNRRNRIIYLVSTGLLSALMIFSATMYFLNHEMVAETFTKLGYPTYIIYPLAIAKILGIIAIWTKRSRVLKEWAYAGFFFDFVLAFTGHIMVNDGQYMASFVAIILLLVSYNFESEA